MDQVLYKQTLKNAMDSVTDQDTIDQGNFNRRRRTSKQANRTGSDAACMLMVDQLWCWILADDTILTFAAPKEDGDSHGGSYLQADIRTRIYNDVHGFVTNP